MANSFSWFSDTWLKMKTSLFKNKDDSSIPLDQVSRFYQSELYQSLDAEIKSAFYDGPLGGLDSRIIERKDLAFLNTSHQLWENGRNISCAIYGEKGTGLSTLINLFLNDLKQRNKTYKQINFIKRLSDEHDVIDAFCKQLNISMPEYKLDSFIDQLNDLPPMVIAVDDLHYLVQRTMSAQKVINCISTIILASRGHHFWLFAAEEQSWRRLCYGYQFDSLISDQHHVSNFTDKQIHELLIKRFSYAGFNSINDVSLETLSPDKGTLQEISKRSKGCIELGLFYCLSHLTHGTKPKSIFLRTPQDIDTSALKKLTQNELFTLAEICVHGQLSPKEHAKVFRTHDNESKMILEHLRVLGILDQIEEPSHNQAYKLKLIISAVVIRYLISMNYLY